MKINYLLNICHQFLVNIKFYPTSLMRKMLDFRNYFFKKQHSFKSDYKYQVSNCAQSDEENNCSHDYSHIGLLDSSNVVYSDKNDSIKNKISFGIVSNRSTLLHNHGIIALPLVFKNHQTISLKDVYENLIKSNTAKLRTYQLFEKLYRNRHRWNDRNRFFIDNIDKSLPELYPIHHFKNISSLNNYDEKLYSRKNIVESQKLDSSFSSTDERTYGSLLDTFNHSNKTELDSCYLDIDELSPYFPLQLRQSQASQDSNCNDSKSASPSFNSIAAPTQFKDIRDVFTYEGVSASPLASFISATKSNKNFIINDTKKEQVVIDKCSEEMKTLISDFSLNLKSVAENNPIELTVKHQLFSVSYENNPYFSVKDTPYIGYNSLMELEQDKELIAFPLCFYVQSASLCNHNSNNKLCFILEEQMDADNDLALDYVDNVHSGRIGLIYVSKSDIRKHYNVKRITQKIQDEVKLEAIKFVQLLNQ